MGGGSGVSLQMSQDAATLTIYVTLRGGKLSKERGRGEEAKTKPTAAPPSPLLPL